MTMPQVGSFYFNQLSRYDRMFADPVSPDTMDMYGAVEAPLQDDVFDAHDDTPTAPPWPRSTTAPPRAWQAPQPPLPSRWDVVPQPRIAPSPVPQTASAPPRPSAPLPQSTPDGPPYTRSDDWHIPTLDEVFELAQKYPNKKLILDTKTSGDPAVAARLGQQITAMLHEHPEMIDRLIITNPDRDCLSAIKDAFRNDPDPRLRNFHDFAYDDEHLNDLSPTEEERSPLTGAEDNSWVSIGDSQWRSFDALLSEVQKAHAEIADPTSPDHGKKLMAWVINDPDKIRKLVAAGADGLITDDPAAMNRTLDQMGYGPTGQDPHRPMVIAHHGDSESPNYPENTLPSIEHALQNSDAVEIDICSAKDGIVVFHDNNPDDVTNSMTRNLGLQAAYDWRPTFPDLGSEARGRKMSDLTVDEIRHNYGYERNATHSAVANLALNLGVNLLRLPGTILSTLGRFLHIGGFNPLGWVGDGLNLIVDGLVRPLASGLMAGLDKVVTGLIDAVKDVAGGVWSGVKEIAGGLWDGLGDIFHGRVGSGLLTIGKGLAGGVWDVLKGAGSSLGRAVTGVVDGVSSVVKGIGNAVSNVGHAVGHFFKKLFG